MSTIALQEQTTLRRYALALLRRRNRLLYEMPSILCVAFGTVGAFVGSHLCSLTGSGPTDSIMIAFCLGGVGILGGSGGLLGRRIVDYSLKPYIPVAAAVLLEEASSDKAGKDGQPKPA